MGRPGAAPFSSCRQSACRSSWWHAEHSNCASSGQRPSRSGEGSEEVVYASERFAGPFRRVISLPEDADPSKVEASYRNGVLKLVVSRLEAAKPRHIAINR